MSCCIEVLLYGGIVSSVVYRSAFNRLWSFRYEDIICRCSFILCGGGCRGYDRNVPYIERYTYTIDIWLLLSWIGMIPRLE